MELTKRCVLIVMLVAAGFVVITKAALDNTGEQSEADTVTAAYAQDVVYFPSQYTLITVSEYIPAF